MITISKSPAVLDLVTSDRRETARGQLIGKLPNAATRRLNGWMGVVFVPARPEYALIDSLAQDGLIEVVHRYEDGGVSVILSAAGESAQTWMHGVVKPFSPKCEIA